MTTLEDAQALIGQTFGSGKNQRIVTRIENLRTSNFGAVVGDVYWKRPGGKERATSQWLPYFRAWKRSAERVATVTLTHQEAIALYEQAGPGFCITLDKFIEDMGEESA